MLSGRLHFFFTNLQTLFVRGFAYFPILDGHIICVSRHVLI